MKPRMIANFKSEIMMTDMLYRREQWPSLVRWYVPRRRDDNGCNIDMVVADKEKADELEKIYQGLKNERVKPV